MVDAILFDLMGTVVYDPYLEAIRAATGMDAVSAASIRDRDAWPLFEMGAIDEAEFARRFFAAPGEGRRFDLDAFHRVRQDGYAFLPGMLELIASLEGKVDRYVASNYPAWIDQLGVRFDFDSLFEGVYASCHLGVRKPDPRFFEAILADLDVRPDLCLFVDDRRVNCDAAQQLGLKVHRFEDEQGLQERLRAEGL